MYVSDVNLRGVATNTNTGLVGSKKTKKSLPSGNAYGDGNCIHSLHPR